MKKIGYISASKIQRVFGEKDIAVRARIIMTIVVSHVIKSFTRKKFNNF